MPTQNVNVTDKIAKFVHRQVESGTFKNVSEVHRAALVEMERKEEERRAAIKWLKAEAQKGIDDIEAGRYTTFENAEELNKWADGVLQRVIEESRGAVSSDLDAEPAE